MVAPSLIRLGSRLPQEGYHRVSTHPKKIGLGLYVIRYCFEHPSATRQIWYLAHNRWEYETGWIHIKR